MPWCGGMSSGGRSGSAGTRSNGGLSWSGGAASGGYCRCNGTRDGSCCYNLVVKLVVIAVVVVVLEAIKIVMVW